MQYFFQDQRFSQIVETQHSTSFEGFYVLPNQCAMFPITSHMNKLYKKDLDRLKNIAPSFYAIRSKRKDAYHLAK